MKKQTYNVEKVDGQMIVTKNPRGNYRATTSEEIKQVLTNLNFQTTTAEVRIGKIWKPLKGYKHVSRKKYEYAPKRIFSEPEPIKPLSCKLKILKALHLYKDPLEVLIYRG